MRRLAFALAGLLLLTASQARAADATPGSSCSTANQWTWAGAGPDGGFLNGMFCNGSTWNGAINFQSSGNVGIGTTNPTYKLDIEQNTNSDVATLLQNSYASGGAAYAKIAANSTYVGNLWIGTSNIWYTGEFGSNNFIVRDWTNSLNPLTIEPATPANTLYLKSSGRVGIGTTSPAALLDVAGEIRAGNTALACSASTTGAIRYNTGTTSMQYCNGSAWSPFNPAASSGVCMKKDGFVTDTTMLGSPSSLAVSGNYAFVTSGNSRLTAVNITNPNAPTIASSLNDTHFGNANFVAVSGSYAYVTGYTNNNLTIVNISNPNAMIYVGSVSDATRLHGGGSVVVNGNYAYVAGNLYNGVTIINIATPSAPTIVGTVTNGTSLASPSEIALSGSYLYVVAATHLTTINISSPTAPTIAGTVTNSGLNNGFGVYLSGNYAFITTGSPGNTPQTNGLAVVNIATPSTPTYVTNLTSSSFGAAYGIAGSGNFAYIADYGTNRLIAADISTPTTPTDAISYTSPLYLNGASDLRIVGTHGYVVNNTGNSFTVFSLDCT